jgi:hypothetical protein
MIKTDLSKGKLVVFDRLIDRHSHEQALLIAKRSRRSPGRKSPVTGFARFRGLLVSIRRAKAAAWEALPPDERPRAVEALERWWMKKDEARRERERVRRERMRRVPSLRSKSPASPSSS